MRSKTHIGKKIISLILSLVMVITIIPSFAISASAADGDTLFHYTFNAGRYDDNVGTYGTNYDDNGSNGIAQQSDWSWDVGDHYAAETDRYWFKDGWTKGSVASAIRSTSNDVNKNWKITFEFKYNALKTLRNTAYTLGLAASNTDTAFFGIANNGNLVYNGTADVESVCSFVSGTTYIMDYVYNDGKFEVYLDGVKKCSYAPTSAEKTVLEGVQYIAIGGSSAVGTGMDCYDLIAEEKRTSVGVASYLTDEASFNSLIGTGGLGTRYGTVTWDGTENAAYFNGGHIEIADNPLKSVTNSTGFTISFDFKRLNTNENFSRFIDINDGTTTNTFAINAGSDSDNSYNRGRTLAKVNGTECNYYSNDLANGDYTTGGGAAWLPDSGVWYNLTVIMDASGYYSYYVDGVWKGTFRSDYNTVGLSNGVTPAQIKGAFAGMTQVNIGKAIYNDPTFKGYIKNVHLVAQDVNSTLSSNATIEDAIAFAQAKFNGHAYVNATAAYKAYYNACEALDAATYGEDTAKLNSARTALITAINNMTDFSKPTANAVQSYQANASDSGVDRAASNSVNILSSNRNSTTGQTTAASQEIANCSTKVFYSENVLLYDGSIQPRFPVTFSCVRTSNKTRYVHTMYPASSDGQQSSSSNASTDFDLHHDKDTTHANCWYGSDTNNSRIDYGYNFTLSEKVGGNATNSENHWSAKLNSSTTHYYVNAVRYIGTPDAAIKDFAIKWSQRSSGVEQVSGASITNDDYGTMTSSVHTYVYNYAGIKSRVESRGQVISSVNNYKEGGLTTLLGYTDSITRSWSTLMGDISGANTTYSNISTTNPTADTRADAYQALRDTITSSRTIGTQGASYSVHEAYQNGTDTIGFRNYAAFKTAYEAARDMFAALDNDDNASGYALNNIGNTSTSGTLAYLNNQLATTFAALDIVTVNAPTVSGETYLGPTDVITVTDTNNGAATYKWQYSTDGGSSWTDGGSIANAGGSFAPFANDNYGFVTAGTAKIRVAADLDGAEIVTSAVDYTYFTAPTMDKNDGDVVTANTTVSFATTKAGADGTIQYKLDNGNWTAGDSVTLFTGNTTTATLQVREIKNTSTSDLTSTYTIKRKPNAPTVTPDGDYLDASHGITVTSNDSSLDVDATLMVCSTENGTYVPFSNLATNGKYYPFANDTPSGTSMQSDLYVKAVRNGAESDVVHITYASLGWPSIVRSSDDRDLAANDELTATDTLYLETSTGEAGGTLKYAFSIDGGSTWSEAKTYSSAITPFAETVTIGGNSVNLANKVNISMKAWEERDGSSSGENVVGPVLLKKTTPLSVYYKNDATNATSNDSYNDNGHFFINTDGYEGCAIYYQAEVDGVLVNSFNSYSINAGIDSDTYTSNKVVTFKFYVIENNAKTVFAQGTFYSDKNYNELAFKESFDGASASGSTLTLSGSNGTATATSADSFSIVDGAGYSDGTNSPDWRNNVLKINSNSNKDYRIALARNPLNSDAATKLIAKRNGITISLWRYVPDGKFTNTAEYWTPTLSFSQPRGANGERYYFLTTESAYVTRSDSAIDGNNDYNKYVDIKPDEQDPTQHATGNRRNRWLNVVITVDPTSGVTVYTNGEPHNTTVTAGTGGSHGNYSGNNAALAQDILDFVTNDSTTLSFSDGQGYWDFGGKDLYLDDIRIYTDVKTQVDINNMYIYDADVKSDISSTSHDPTNVAVYTLARAVATDSNGTKPIGAKVGQEFIDYYGLDANDPADVSAVDEYSFGTGMTVYHLNKTTGKWDVVGDANGKCGYQNEKLFGAEYHTGIAAALSAATGSGSGGGAGHLVWAPHVMYNLTTDKWVYYGSTSSWGVQKSAIFMCQNDTNDDVTGPYTYKEISYQSTSHPNAIDACVYYGRDGSGKPVPANLYMAFGSWGGSNAIASKTLNANGTSTGNTYDRIIAAGISESASSDGSSAEGAWITYENGYYYLYVSYGQNTGSYAERVFRSTVPNNNFVDLADVPATNTENKMKGNQIISPFDMSNYNYTFKSTGHNSVYKTVNNDGEIVTLHSTHARPNTNANHNWIAIPDNALATCQSEVDGNLNLINQVAYNSLGWPVLMPYQYDGTDTVTAEIKGEDIEGVYAADDLRTYVSDTWAPQYNYTIVADDEDPNAAYEYGTDEGGETFTDYIVLSTGTDGTRYANYYATKADYDPENPNSNLEYCGVVGKHGNKICISMICPDDREHTWTYRIGEIPKSDEVDSLGDSVSMDGVIYTHASTAATNNATFTYALYGTEISDDYQYGTSDLHQGERCTTITTSYPAKIDISNPTAIYCVSDEAIAKSGDYSGSDFRVVALNDDKWFDEAGNRFSDVQAISYDGISPNDGTKLKRRYGVKGFVSNYYYDSSTGEYKDTGVELIVSYSDVSTGSNYSEFEFCYVSANPSMAHTVSGSRNEHEYALQGDKRAGIILFDRFLGSSGTATNVRSSYTYQYNWDDSNYYKKGHESGIFNYLGEWGSAESLDDNARDYKTPENMANNFHADNETVNGRTFKSQNSGAFAQIEINRRVYRDAIATSPVVIDTDYYIDYSNEDNYDINNKYGTITTSAGKPTGYSFTMRTANINWSPQQSRRWGATSYMLNNIVDIKGNKITTNSSYDTTKGDKLPTELFKPYSQFTDGGNDGETRLYYGNVNNTNGTKNSDSPTLESGLGEYSTNTTHHRGRDDNGDQFDFEAKYTLGVGDSAIGRKVMSGYYTNPTQYDTLITNNGGNDYYTKGISATGRDANGNLTFSARSDGRIEKAFDYIDSGNSATNAWNMHIDFNGKYSVPKNTDTSLPAEQYANFILEQGISTMCWWTGWNTRYEASVQEVYKYYNIGVNTCDKGAARAFAKNYLRKRLAVTNNSDGTVTVKRDEYGAPIYLDEDGDETTNVEEAAIITPSHYSLSSYQEYIDAVAELNYFVKNPQNTTFKDYANSGSNASTEYVTAYHDGIPYYVTDEDGANIFGDAGTVNTDEVQAKLINDVITAYENLFAVEDYSKAEETYASIELLDGDAAPATASDVDEINIYSDKEAGTISATYSKDDYTEDSWLAFVNLVMNVSEAFDYSKASTGKESWRNVELSGSEYRKLEDILKNANDTLLPAVNIATLTATHTTKSADVAGGIFEGGVQTKTYSSWLALKDECENAYDTYLDTSAQSYARAQQATIDGDDVVDGADDEADFTYTQGQYAVTGVTKCTFDNVTFYARTVDTSTPSDEQALVNTENTTLSGMNLVGIDRADAYASYNAAYSVIDSLDMDMYTAAGVNLINNAKSTTDAIVFKTLDASEATAYNNATGASVASGTKLKNTANGLTDAQTVTLLSASGTVNDPSNKATYIKKLKVLFTWETDDNTGGTFDTGEGNLYYDTRLTEEYYGDSKTFTLPSEAQTDYTVSNWSLTMYPGDATSDDPFGQEEETDIKPEGSQKVSGYDRFSLTRVITKNMTVYAQLVKNEAAESNNRYNIYDVYNKLIDVVYSDTELSEGDSATEAILPGVAPKKMPFYTFTKWTVTKTADKVYNIKPTYTVNEEEQTYSYTIIDGATTVNKSALYDKKVAIEYHGSGTFAAWAVRTGSAGNYKYQIASYSPSYYFYAVTGETYVALVSDGNGGYAPAADTENSITAADLEGQLTNIGTNDADELVNNKIHDKVAFVSVEKTYMSADNKQARVYVRITEGAETAGTENFTSYGVLFVNGNVASQYEPTFVINGNIGGGTIYRRAVTNKLETGQFTYTLNNKNAFPNNVTFRAYVNYDYTYTISNTSSGMSDTTVTVNGTDYSNVLVATKNL